MRDSRKKYKIPSQRNIEVGNSRKSIENPSTLHAVKLQTFYHSSVFNFMHPNGEFDDVSWFCGVHCMPTNVLK